MSNQHPSVESTIKATGSVLGLLPQVAGFVVGFSALAYITGWREASAYYGGLGASWVLSLLTPAQIMQTSIWLVTIIALFAFMSIYQLTQGAASQKGLRRWSIILLLLSAAFLISSLFLGNSASNAVTGAASICLAISAGLTIGELVASLAEGDMVWGEYQIFLLFFAVFYGLLQASTNMGDSRARIAGASDSPLPKVALLSETDALDWRLVAPMGGKILLLSPSEERKNRRFKLVESSDIDQIGSGGTSSSIPGPPATRQQGR